MVGVLEGLQRALGRGGSRTSSRDPHSSRAGQGVGAGDKEGQRMGGKGEGQGEKFRMEEERERVGRMLKDAREGLSVERVFGGGWWRGDGSWGYEVWGEEAVGDGLMGGEGDGDGVGSGEGKGEGKGEEIGEEEVTGKGWGKGEATFKEVVEGHPVVREWVGRVRGEMERWGVREDGGFGGAEWEAGRVEEGGELEVVRSAG